MSEWSEWHEMPTDAPRVKDHSRRGLVINWIVTRMLYVGVLSYGVNFAWNYQDPASGGLTSAGASAPYVTVLLFGMVVLVPFALVALLAARGRK